MRRPTIESLLWTAAIALTAIAVLRTRAVSAELTGAVQGALPVTLTGQSAVAARGLASPRMRDSIVERDPFRLERRPSAASYRLVEEPLVPQQPIPPKPALSVTGIVGGPPWEALVEGIPGRQGSVLVRRGDTLGGLRVRALGRDTVTITGMDTTWNLTVRRAWE